MKKLFENIEKKVVVMWEGLHEDFSKGLTRTIIEDFENRHFRIYPPKFREKIINEIMTQSTENAKNFIKSNKSIKNNMSYESFIDIIAEAYKSQKIYFGYRIYKHYINKFTKEIKKLKENQKEK